MLWIEVLFSTFKLFVCVVYRPPGSTTSFWDNFDYSLEQALQFTENIIITGGDLNVDLLTQINHKRNEILTLYDLTHVINEPTRMGALLDPVIVSNIDVVVDSDRCACQETKTFFFFSSAKSTFLSIFRCVWFENSSLYTYRLHHTTFGIILNVLFIHSWP